jgi:hypothetical protein
MATTYQQERYAHVAGFGHGRNIVGLRLHIPGPLCGFELRSQQARNGMRAGHDAGVPRRELEQGQTDNAAVRVFLQLR